MDFLFLCDFDNTITINDTIDLISDEKERILNEKKYINNEINFENCLNNILITIKKTIDNLNDKVYDIDNNFIIFYNLCKYFNWDFKIISSNGKLLIKKILNVNNINIDENNILSNEFIYSEDGWKIKKFISKSDYIKEIIEKENKFIIYIGDGISDIDAVNELVKYNNFLVFAKIKLYNYFINNLNNFVLFKNFIEIQNYMENLLMNNMFNDELKLMSPGVVKTYHRNYHKDHFTAMHRDKYFHLIYKLWKFLILKIFNPFNNYDIYEKYNPCIITGSGTSTMDIIISCIINHDKILFCSNGMFGERWLDMGKFYNNNNVIMYKKNWGEMFVEDEIIEILNNNSVKYILFVHHDTSVGIHNDLSIIKKIKKQTLHDLYFIVDCVSSVGVYPITLDNIDILITNPNKGLGSIQGFGIAIINNNLMKNFSENKCPNYINLVNMYNLSLNNETTNTPCIISIKICIDILKYLDYNKIIDKYYDTIEFQKILRENINSDLFLLDDNKSFPAISTIFMNNSNNFIDYCRKNKLVIYPAKKNLENKAFQISFYGNDANANSILLFLKLYNEYKLNN